MTPKSPAPVDKRAVVARERWWYHEHVEPTSRPAPSIADDSTIAEALRAFVCALGPSAADIRLEFAAGAVTLTGAVASETHRRAVADLLAAHDGVTNVICDLRVSTPSVVTSSF